MFDEDWNYFRVGCKWCSSPYFSKGVFVFSLYSGLMSLYDSYKPKSNIWLSLYEWAYELICGCFDKPQKCSFFVRVWAYITHFNLNYKFTQILLVKSNVHISFFLASITITDSNFTLTSHQVMNIIIISFLLKCFEGVKPLLYMLLHMVSFIIRYELNAA